ncbi:MAG: transporter [Nitrospirae bacterium]|nr:transporter [Nitrospirota bacterium]
MASRIVLGVLILAQFLFQSRPAFALLPYLASETAVPVERGKSRLDVSLLDERWKRTLSSMALTTELSYGLINNLDFSVEAPYRFRLAQEAPDEDGLGDLKLKAKIRFIKGREANPVSIAGQLTVKFPSCNSNKALSPDCTGEPDVGVRAIASKEFFPVTLHLNLGYVFVGNPANTTLNDVFNYSLAFDYLTVADHLRVAGELAGETNRYPKSSTLSSRLAPGTSANPLSALVGLLYDMDVDKVLSLAWSHGLTKASPHYGLSVGFRYLF